MDTSNDSPRTPDRIIPKPQGDTIRRSRYLWDAKNKKDDETWEGIARRNDISASTGERWRREQRLYGTPTASRRTRKLKARLKGTKLGRPYEVPEETIAVIALESNPVATHPLYEQAEYFGIDISERALRANLGKREAAHIYAAVYTRDLRENNQKARLQYGREHCDKPILGFQDTVFFTNEAYFNPIERLQKPRILRKKGNQNRARRTIEQKPIKSSGASKAIYIYATVNWYYKLLLEFYNDERDILLTPKPPPKPRKLKYKTNSQF